MELRYGRGVAEAAAGAEETVRLVARGFWREAQWGTRGGEKCGVGEGLGLALGVCGRMMRGCLSRNRSLWR